MDINYVNLGKRIRYYRKLQGYTQEDFAFALDTSPAYVSNIERGIKKPSLQKLFEICSILNITLNDLLPAVPAGYDNHMNFDTLVKQYPEGSRQKILQCLAEIIQILSLNT